VIFTFLILLESVLLLLVVLFVPGDFYLFNFIRVCTTITSRAIGTW
jgi:hypothetical protein